ncbi:MAG: LytTR family DNA-binding domain-containing protein [Rudaea sp.]|uniref:LytR/AlgR family response regulator transcription factor n=1 Tax=Rudaea sp. TaxID=2136325 RepID=UPI0039E4E8BB
MNVTHPFEFPSSWRTTPGWLREGSAGLLYWLLFLLVLEPDNVQRAIHAGHPLQFGHEVPRIAVAALLGAAITPFVVAATRRFPVAGTQRTGHALAQIGIATGLGFVLILISCLLVAWGFQNRWLPSLTHVREELVANWPLLIYALLAFMAAAHAARHLRPLPETRDAPMRAPYRARIAVKTRGRHGFADLAAVDWIESQGNYLALHAGSSSHLIRETLTALESQLDPAAFVRIHRRMIVAVSRIRDLRPIANGDALLRLAGGQELRVSRSYRRTLAEKWHALPPTPNEE